MVFSGSAFGFGAGFGFGFGVGFDGSDVVGVVVLVTFVFFGAMYWIAVLPCIACTSMNEGSSLDPDPAGLPATCTGGMETRRGGSFRDCAGNRVDARIANNHIGPATITARKCQDDGRILASQLIFTDRPIACFNSRTSDDYL